MIAEFLDAYWDSDLQIVLFRRDGAGKLSTVSAVRIVRFIEINSYGITLRYP